MSAIGDDMDAIGKEIGGVFSALGSIFGLPSPPEILAGIANGVGAVVAGATELITGFGGFFGRLVGGLLDGAQIPILDPTKILNLPQFFAGLVEALTGQDGTGATYIDPINHLKYQADTVAGHTQAIEELKAANDGQSSTGMSAGGNFSTPHTGSLGPGWAITSTDGVTTYVDTSTGVAKWHNSGNAAPILIARRTDPAEAKTLTEFQKITTTLASPITTANNSQNRVHCRTSDDGQHYVFAYVSKDTIYIGYTTTGVAGEQVVESGPFPAGIPHSNGALLSIEAGVGEDRDEYDVRISGVRGQSWTDDTNLATTSANFAARGLAEAPKGWAIGWRPGNELGFWKTPSALAGWTVVDHIPALIKGHGFRVYRESATTSPALAVGDNMAPHYDEIDYISQGSAWSALGYTIPEEGHWVFHITNRRGGGNWDYAVFGVQSSAAGLPKRGTAVAMSVQWNVAVGSGVLYCEKGDVVKPYVASKSGTVAMTGSSNGLDCSFAGALTSK
ncbi:MAG: hypothetical protein K2Y33_02045 [Mycolicibacterium frederiksbergense]|nr:hypothetical protein [Mycolicibacterium frederiksbergense]